MALRLVGKAMRYPDRAILRMVLRARLARRDLDSERTRLFRFLSDRFAVDGAGLAEDYEQSTFARWYRKRSAELRRYPGALRMGTTGAFGCEALYLSVRSARPRVVVETGVLYGASSAHILAALDHNAHGELYSIELGGTPDEPPHDYLVPPELQARWRLILGDSRRELPALLDRLPSIDLFHHDSLHTFEHMTWELETAFAHLRDGGVLSSDDVLIAHSLREIRRENAFPRFCRLVGADWALFGNFGLALRRLLPDV